MTSMSDEHWAIVTAHRGWIYVGRVQRTAHPVFGDVILISPAMNLRTWGTRRGLGELKHGPLPLTVLDLAGEVPLSPWMIVAPTIVCGAPCGAHGCKGWSSAMVLP